MGKSLSVELHGLCSSTTNYVGDQIKENEMGRNSYTHEADKIRTRKVNWEI
jgi:hypothetical protein